MGLLDGGLRSVFGAAFGGIYLDASLYRIVRTDAENGDVTEAPEAGEAVKVQIDKVTEQMKGLDRYTARSMRLLMLQVGPDGVVARPNTDAEVSVGADRWAVSDVSSDPGNTYWENARQSGLMASVNDNRQEDLALRPAIGPHYVTLQAGRSMCSFCGHIWDWREPMPKVCPLEND
jgi:hypothetical protein